MRLLMFGHWSHTGFGRVTEELGRRFLDRGYDVRVLAVNHRGEPVRGPMAGRVWPTAMFGEAFGGNISSGAIDGSLWRRLDPADDWKADQVLVVSDMSGLQGHIGKTTEAWLSVPVWHYCPIEGENLPVSWRDIWNDPSNGKGGSPFRPVAMSLYGQRVLRDHLGREVPMIYHGVDTATFHPATAADPVVYQDRVLRSKEACKAVWGFPPESKIVLRTDRYVPRKFYDVTLRAMAEVFDLDPAVTLVIHCRPHDEGGNLYEEMARLAPRLWPRMKLTEAHDTWTGLPVEGLVALYNAADLYIQNSSEGFGLTIAEALACGVPVVGIDHSAVPEVIGPGGVAVPPLTDRYGEPVWFHSTYGMDWAVPDGRAMVEPITTLLAKPQRRKALGEAGRNHVRRSFNWDVAADQFAALFDTV